MYHDKRVQGKIRKKHIKGKERIKREEILTQSINMRSFFVRSII